MAFASPHANKTNLVAADMIKQQQLAVSYRQYDPYTWPLAPGQDDLIFSPRDIFPPDNMIGADNSNQVVQRIVQGWSRYPQKPHLFTGYSDVESVAAMIDTPRLYARDIERMAYDPAIKIAYDLAYRMDEVFGLEGALVQHAVPSDPHNPNIIDMPFKMHGTFYKRNQPRDHAALLVDVFNRYQTNASELCRHFKVHGLNADVMNHIVTHAFAPELFDQSDEIMLGRGISRKFDMMLFSEKEGPFTRYYDERIAHKDSDPVYAYEFLTTPTRRYQDIFRHTERLDTYTPRQEKLHAQRTQFYHNLLDQNGVTRTPDQMAHDTKIRFTTLMGWTAPHARDAYHMARYPQLEQAGFEQITNRAVTPDQFISPEERNHYFTLSEIRQNFTFADQPNKSWPSFTAAANKHLYATYEQIKDVTGVNAETALGRNFYPTTRDNAKNGRETFYISGTLYDSWVKHGVLVLHQPA
jgi:hypothetical protein